MKRDWFILLALFGLVLLAGGTLFVRERFKTRKAFLDAIRPAAQQLERETGIRQAVTLTQAAHESGYGLNPDNALVYEHYNLFGIKAGKAWADAGKPVGYVLTTEYVDGKPVKVKATPKNPAEAFRAYGSYIDSMRDWVTLLVRLYPDAYKAAQAGDLVAFANGLKNGKAGAYATDPAYFASIQRVGKEVEALA